jgi:hypothetical protein
MSLVWSKPLQTNHLFRRKKHWIVFFRFLSSVLGQSPCPDKWNTLYISLNNIDYFFFHVMKKKNESGFSTLRRTLMPFRTFVYSRIFQSESNWKEKHVKSNDILLLSFIWRCSYLFLRCGLETTRKYWRMTSTQQEHGSI